MRRGILAELRGSLPEEALCLVPRSFDILGSKQRAVAIVELQEGLEAYEEAIAEAVMRVQKNVVSVLAKESAREGNYRVRKLRLLKGNPDTEVVHRESGCHFRLDPRNVYFSTRESNERNRIISTIVDGEEILVMFSGVGPLPIRIAKARPGVRATAVELNLYAHNYCVENIHMNRVADRVETIQGDVREVCPRLGRRFDRVLMPLPKGAYRFLDVATPLLKDGGTLSLYHWAPGDDLFTEAEALLREAFEGDGRGIEFLRRVKVSQYNPKFWKVRVDVKATRP